MDTVVEHWFNRRYRAARRDVYLCRDSFGWFVRARTGGPDGSEVTHTFADADAARAMVEQLKKRVPPGQDDWVLITSSRR
ncbi:hypothetical protein AB0M20_23575 [Actinoplanes sp. NPDC051633]|uniref:hypothetical protein n=1 Tax=Actinoplanes sp. NPDC051633 TaxID=3155670 RepID=UPI00342A4ADB